MTSIDAVTITAQSDYASDPTFSLYADPGSIPVGYWNAGIPLQQPDGDRRRRPCSDVDEAVHEATLTWNTAEGFATLERWVGVRRAAATWTGERRHEWQGPKQLVALVKATIQQAVKDGVLPMPNDYRVTWRSDDEAIYVRTLHDWVRDQQITETVKDLLRPFNASGAGDFDGHVVENWVFNTQVEEPTGPKKVRSLPLVDRMRLERTHRVAVMERAGFPAADIAKVQASFATYAPAAE